MALKLPEKSSRMIEDIPPEPQIILEIRESQNLGKLWGGWPIKCKEWKGYERSIGAPPRVSQETINKPVTDHQ